ncbi:MAG: O-antigen ligase family protein [Ignavibacteriaceae bacterium]|nr:O-antigen ligase family protein [Ignavibacteriaceae bacterium]
MNFFIKDISFNPKLVILYSFGIVFATLISPLSIYLSIGLLIGALSYLYLGRNLVVVAILLSYLVLVSDIVSGFRTVINLVSSVALLVLVLNKHGLRISAYPRPNYLLLIQLVFLLFLMIVSTFYSGYYMEGFSAFTKTIIFLLIVYMFFILIDGEKVITLYLNGLIASSIIIALATIYDGFFTANKFIDIATGTYNRNAGFISNINASSIFFIISIPILLYNYFDVSRWNKFLYLSAIILLSMALVISMSRASILSTLATSLAILFLRRRIWFYYLSVFITLTILFLISFPFFNDLFTLLFRLEEGLSQRDTMWQLTVSMIRDNWLLGVGPGSYTNVMFNYIPIMLESWGGLVLKELFEVAKGGNLAHNFYLSYWSELGLFGFIISISIPILFFQLAFKNYKYWYNKNRKISSTVLMFAIIGVGVFIRSFFEGINILTFGWITMDLPFWLIYISLLYFDEQSRNMTISHEN